MSEIMLGISAFYHDSAAALLVDGEILAAAHEERFTRKKHDASFPVHAVQYVLNEAGIGLDHLSAVAFYDKPYVKFERLLETYHAYAPSGLRSFWAAMPVWIKEKLFMKKLIRDQLGSVSRGSAKALLFPEHHLSHAASAFFPSPHEEAAIVTIDGVGEWATTTIGYGKDNDITILRQLDFPHSIGLLYSAFTYFCGFKVNGGEYKLMGLAPYGRAASEFVKSTRQKILDHLVDLRPDGSILLNMDYFDFATGLTMCNEKKWTDLFGVEIRKPESEIAQPYMDLALAVQQVTEEAIFRIAATAYDLTGCENLTMAGGVALNCVANGKLLKQGPFRHLWIQPAAGDAGGALGAAYAAWHIWKNHPRRIPGLPDAMKGAYLGPEYSAKDIERLARRYAAPYVRYPDEDALCSVASEMLAAGKIVGWFQGKMEYGPRALGNRSILGDPRNPDMQKTLNVKVKFREGFRPFAPSVMEEELEKYFDFSCPSPYMLMVAPVQQGVRKPLPEEYDRLGMFERLYHIRSEIPAVTHVDFSARLHSVNRETNPRYWKLLAAFRERTGFGLLVNTSFNVRGEPIVCSPDDAYRCFMKTNIDALVMEDYLFLKSDQPGFETQEG
ncbi:MAG: carbamoyltransferase [Desulfobacteraceae bacterium]|nr:carbamoyltransferase [Desulfobacteraceae bacterium]